MLFLAAIIWALTLVIATWPLMLWVQHHAGNRRGIAVLVMTVTLLLVLIVPFWLAIGMIMDNTDKITEFLRSSLTFRLPQPPTWLGDVPLVGQRMHEDLGKAGFDRDERACPQAEALCRGVGAMVRDSSWQSRRHFYSIPADDRHSGHYVFAR